MMTKETLAEMLDGRTIGNEITRAEAEAAKAAGLVVVFGGSDDLMELRGAIHDEIGCFTDSGVRVLVSADGHAIREDRRERTPARAWRKIEALWCHPGEIVAWMYRTDIPHTAFTITEDGEAWCRGIVFALADLAEANG